MKKLVIKIGGVRVDRLERLVELLEKDAKNKKGVKFDLRRWASVPLNEDGTFEKPGPSCGTYACAFGLAAVSGEFKGLRAVKYVPDGGDATAAIFDVVYKKDGMKHFGFDAASELFGIGQSTADKLFHPRHYEQTTGALAEMVVASRIHDFVGMLKDGLSEYSAMMRAMKAHP